MSAASIARPETPKLSEATTDSLMWASPAASPRAAARRCAPHQIGAVAGHVPQPTDRRWRDEAGPQHLPLGDLGKPHRVQSVGLGPAWQVLDVLALTSQTSNPWASSR